MQRTFLCAILSAVSIPAASLWAASPVTSPSSQFASQIAYEAGRVKAAADGLQGYVLSGANGRSALVYARDMQVSAKRLASLVDQAASQPGMAGEARARAEKMKVQAAGLNAMVNGAVSELKPGRIAAEADAIVADTTNIENRSNTLRAAAQTLNGVN
jgi:hypothetical protein